MKVLVTYNIPRESFAKLGKEHTITMPEGEYFTTEELIKLVPDYKKPCMTKAPVSVGKFLFPGWASRWITPGWLPLRDITNTWRHSLSGWMPRLTLA